MQNSTWMIPAPARAAPGFWNRLAQALLLLLAIQASRAAITVLLWAWLRPDPTSELWTWFDLAALSAVGLALLIIFHPTPAALGLEWRTLSRLGKSLSSGFLILVVVLVLTTGFIDPTLLLENSKNALLIPLFEELLFRGWIWNRLETTLNNGKSAGPLNWVLNSALFALWHLGYFDIYVLKALPASPGINLAFFLLMKLATTFVIGLMVGFLRWRTRRVFGSLALHGLINLFGR